MSRRVIRFVFGVVCVLALLTAVAAAQQSSTSTERRDFEVVAVNGNVLVTRESAGTKEYTVPESFRFTVGGKPLSVHELQPGMKGTATFTTTTTVTPVTVTEVKEGTVMKTMGNSVIVRGADGIKMFSEGDLSKRNIRIIRDGRPVEIAELHEGDRLSAVIVTSEPPRVMTEQDVTATITAAAATAATTAAGAATTAAGAATTAAGAAADAAATSAAAAATAATDAASAAQTAAAGLSGTDSQGTNSLLWIVIGLVAIIAVAVVIWRRRSAAV